MFCLTLKFKNFGVTCSPPLNSIFLCFESMCLSLHPQIQILVSRCPPLSNSIFCVLNLSRLVFLPLPSNSKFVWCYVCFPLNSIFCCFETLCVVFLSRPSLHPKIQKFGVTVMFQLSVPKLKLESCKVGTCGFFLLRGMRETRSAMFQLFGFHCIYMHVYLSRRKGGREGGKESKRQADTER